MINKVRILGVYWLEAKEVGARWKKKLGSVAIDGAGLMTSQRRNPNQQVLLYAKQ